MGHNNIFYILAKKNTYSHEEEQYDRVKFRVKKECFPFLKTVKYPIQSLFRNFFPKNVFFFTSIPNLSLYVSHFL